MKLLRTFFLTIFLLFIFLISFNVLKYKGWEKEFFQKKGLRCLQSVQVDQEKVEEKFKKFVLSNNKTEFVVLDTDEIIYILEGSMQKGEEVLLEDLCVLSSKGVWTILVKYEVKGVTMPWLVLDIVKDDRETSEIYVKNLSIGNTPLPFGVGKKMERNVNKGIREAITLLNENEFLGREIKNIELIEEKVVIR